MDATADIPTTDIATADIAIAGTGHTALTAALVLARAVPHWRIALLGGADAGGGADPRVTVLAAGSREIFAQLGIWPGLAARAAPILDIRIDEHAAPAWASLGRVSAADAFGHVIENPVLSATLAAAVAVLPNVERLPAVTGAPRPAADHIAVPVAGAILKARLLIAADGTNSPLRGMLGIDVDARDYGTTALLATLALEASHGGLAFEHFTASGPLALLPLPARDGRERMALVWVLPPRRAAELAALAPERRLAELHAALPRGAAAVTAMGAPALVPLRRIRAREQVRSRLVLAGNAAHSLHPVAGQGFNLTVRDLAALAQQLRESAAAGGDPGELRVLSAYARGRERDQQRTQIFSETLPALFARPELPLRLGRQLGLIALDRLPPLRRAVARFGAGLSLPAHRVVDADA